MDLPGLGNIANQFGSGIGGILGGLFGNSGKAYSDARNVYNQYYPSAQGYLDQGRAVQNPFYNAGVGAVPGFQKWLSGMQDPTSFINSIMGQYHQSPWATAQQDQSQRAALNAASAGGLMGSTPLTQFAAQQAHDITSQDQQNFLQNVLGINTQYGTGLQNLMGGGQNAANVMSNLYGQSGQLQNQYAQALAELAYGERAGKEQDKNNLFGGIGNLISSGLNFFGGGR